MKDRKQLSVQADAHFGTYTTTDYAGLSAEEGGDYESHTHPFVVLAFNVLYQFAKVGDWKMHGGGGLMVDKGSTYTDLYFDVKVMLTRMWGSHLFRTEARLGFASYVVFILLAH